MKWIMSRKNLLYESKAEGGFLGLKIHSSDSDIDSIFVPETT